MSTEQTTYPKYVYLLSARAYGHYGFFKVGVTNNPKRRFREVSQGVPFHMITLTVVKDNDPLKLEADFLHRFKEYVFRGEWLRVALSPDLDCSKCLFREYMRDFNKQARLMENELCSALIDMSSHGEVDALLQA